LVVCRATVVLPAVRVLAQCLACAALQVGRPWNSASTVGGQVGPNGGDRPSGVVRVHAAHKVQGAAPRGNGFVCAGLGSEAVTKVGVRQRVDTLVLLGIPAHKRCAVLLLGAGVVAQAGKGTGSVTGDCAGSGAADERESGLLVIGTGEGVLGGKECSGCGGVLAGG